MVGKGRSKSKGPKGKRLRTIERKPIRPLERQRMRPWLMELLDNNSCHQLVWISRREYTFRVAWKHAAGQTFDPESDATLFELWARHTGKYYTGDKPDPKKWKANFRCALNSLPDVDEDRGQGVRKGNNAFKVYKFLEEKEKKMKKSSQQKSILRPDEHEEEESEDEYRPHYRAVGTRSRPKKVVQHADLDSEGSDNGSGGSSPGPMDWDTNEKEDQEELSPLPKFDEICQHFPKQFATGFTIPPQRLPETHSPQASDDNDDEGCSDSPTVEDIVETISDMMSEEPNHQFWETLMSQPTDNQEAPEVYLDTTDSVHGMHGPSVIVETEIYMPDYSLTSLDLSQL